MGKQKHTFYNYQFKHTAVSVANHPDIQGMDVAEALNIHPFMLYRWQMIRWRSVNSPFNFLEDWCSLTH